MAAPKRPQGEELQRRIQAWGDEWRAAAGSTERADRARAERAIASLYTAAGKPVPTFAWVPSPAAGIATYPFARLRHQPIVSSWARGDIGTGENREFNGLAQPFGMEPAWTSRLSSSVHARIPSELLPQQVLLGEVARSAAGLGFGGTSRILPLVRAAIQVWPGPQLPSVPAEPSAVDAAAGVLGGFWPWLVNHLGADLARAIFAEATQRVARTVLHTPRRDAVQAMQPGQWDGLTPVLAASRDVFGGYVWRDMRGRAAHDVEIDARLEIARSAGPWWALDGVAIVSERPLVLHRDDRGRPHSADGPAIAWADGLEVHAWHGVGVEPWIIREPELITVESIDEESNVEVRRVLIERFGEERLIREGGSELVGQDEVGRLWRRSLKPRFWGRTEDPIVMVEVLNSTPEPDGSRKTYFLRVPPNMHTPRQAVAWTFGLGSGEYRPEAQS